MECTEKVKVKQIVFVNRRAMRYFKANVESGDIKKIKKQVDKGTVKIYRP